MSAAHTIYCVKVLNTTKSLALQAFNTVDHVLFPLCILVVVGMLLSIVDTHGVGPADNNDSATMALSLILLVLLVCVVVVDVLVLWCALTLFLNFLEKNLVTLDIYKFV